MIKQIDVKNAVCEIPGPLTLEFRVKTYFSVKNRFRQTIFSENVSLLILNMNYQTETCHKIYLAL